MSEAQLEAETLFRGTQAEAMISRNHQATPMIVNNYNHVGHASNAIFGDNLGSLNQHAPGGQNERKAIDEAEGLRYLMQNIAPGAIHDSNERCDAPKCMEETRVAVQEDIMGWIEAEDRESKRIMWVTGPAGTGKTAILGTIADTCKDKGILAASFFFSAFTGSANRRTKRCFVPTLAFQLMGHGGLRGTREHVLLSAARDQGIIFTKNLKEQFISIVMNPLLYRPQESGSGAKAAPRVIIIDGLDECDAEQYQLLRHIGQVQVGGPVFIRPKEDDQKEILSILLLAANDPSFPFRILISSRPEKEIRNFFSTDGKTRTRELFLDNSYDPDADIALFYTAKFSKICYDLGIKPEDWPGNDAKVTLVKNASGQFIYAATVMRYVEGAPYSSATPNISGRTSTPHRRLEHILGLAPTTHSPLEALDALYRLLLEACPDPDLSMKWLRATQLQHFLDHKAVPWLLRLVLETSPGEERHALGPLASLLSTEISGENLRKPYSFYHKSFLDFIADPTRCDGRFLTDDQLLAWVAQRFFQTLDHHVAALPLHESNLGYYGTFIRMLTDLTRASFEVAKPDILSSDLQKWTAALTDEQVPWKSNSDRPLALTWMLTILHNGVSGSFRHRFDMTL
ncbi:hypothetical protein D9611_009868 [Ephemerocybe angulata]|uniref:NACHT domain-containing protein n=1 Tax=Ephemerocybe angulata TaxID=980116 RepID=A0A8H5CCR9_9AGAR|nr:hypothetical protein D9611_009868 [Tulosesus angulatus]